MSFYGFEEPTPEQLASEARRKAWSRQMRDVLGAGLNPDLARLAAAMLSSGRFTDVTLAQIADLLAKIPRKGDW